jgi:hypothetical protein
MAQIESKNRATDPGTREGRAEGDQGARIADVLLWFTDPEGHLKSSITTSEVEGALDDGMAHGSSITGHRDRTDRS